MHEHSQWEPVIGLEIHVALSTRSKIFSGAPHHFGDPPNTNIDIFSTGQPGTLPVLNREVIQKAVQFGCAVGADIQLFSQFDRKSYFYPDSPRNFQITQFYHPILRGGRVTVEVAGVEKHFSITRAHLEDDAGMLKHFSDFAGVDDNRAGIPLLEIVSDPCFHDPQDAVAYAMAVKSIMQYLGASDCNMEEGSLRIDANVSVRKKGESGLRTKVEIKNMNSFAFLETALRAEIRRQIKLYLQNQKEQVFQATYRWDAAKKETVLMRRKENAEDYRYFPEPDLRPILLTAAEIQGIRDTLPEMPLQRKRRYIQQLELSPQHAALLTANKALADYFEQALTLCPNPRSLCNWIVVEFSGRLKEGDLMTLGIAPREIAALVNLIDAGKVTGKIAKSIADDLIRSPQLSVEQILKDNPGYTTLHNEKEIESYVEEALRANAQSVADYLAGNQKAFASLVGHVMALSRGTADPQLVNRLLRQKLGH